MHSLWIGHALLLGALAAQAIFPPDTTQIIVQLMILVGICVQAGITIATHRWDMRDRARKQEELKREVVGTTQLQLAATKTAAEEVKDAIKGPNGG